MRQAASTWAEFPLRRCTDVLALHTAGPHTVELDPDTAKLQSLFLGSEPVRLQSRSVVADKLKMRRQNVEPKLARLSNCLVHCDRIAQARFIQMVSAHSTRLVMFLDLCRYDATPLPIATEQTLEDCLKDVPHPDGDDVVAAEDGRIASLPAPIPIGKTAGRSHLMDSEHKYAMLVQVGPPGAQEYVAYIGHSLTWLQLSDRSTAEAEKACILETSVLGKDADAFEMKIRVCATDGAASNCVTERSVAGDRGPWMD